MIGGVVLGINAWHAACSSRRGDYVAIFKPPVKVANKNAATTTHLLSPIVSHYYSYCWQAVKLAPGKTFSVTCPGADDDAYAEDLQKGIAETKADCDITSAQQAAEVYIILTNYKSTRW